MDAKVGISISMKEDKIIFKYGAGGVCSKFYGQLDK
jgi:hypothetical protein